MSGKIDQSLDEILSSQRATHRGRGRRVGANTRAAPVGGINKNTVKVAGRAAAKVAAKADAAAPATGGSAKVLVSNLPTDVNEGMIKDYFTQIAGPIKKVLLNYNASGRSVGVATIIFSKPASAKKALEANGTIVDKRSLKVEAILDAAHAKVPDPKSQESKSLGDRVTKPRVQPKHATAVRATTASRGGIRGRGRGRVARGRNAGRPKPKTAAELDAEMTDYFDGNNGTEVAATNGATAAANGGDDLGMDEIS